jgi:glyoxylase-like metal-dependent hydrolase (beta-lactamase superfamily II)
LPGRPITLVDAGMPFPESVEALRAALADWGFRLADVERLVITHVHPDHYGGSAAILRAAEEEGRRVAMLVHPRAAAILRDLPAWWMRAREHSLQLLRRTGAPPRVTEGNDWQRAAARAAIAGAAPSLPVDVALHDGTVIETDAGRWETIHTPGHASTQLCLYEPRRKELLSSDHLLPDVTANMVLEPPLPGEPEAHPILDYLESLRRLQRLDVRRIWPGHGAAFEDVPAVIASRIERCEQRLAQVAAFVADAPKTAWGVAEEIYGGTPAAGSQRALFQVVAYLDALVAEGRIAVDAANAVWRYYRSAGRSSGHSTS